MLWGGLFLVLGPLMPPRDGDLYWQRWLGGLILQTHRLPHALGSETFAAQGAAWVPQEWLFSVAVALAFRYHFFWLLAIAISLLPVAILWSIFSRSREDARPEGAGIALLFCGVALLASFGVRAQVLGWALFAAFLYFLARRDRWYYAAIPTAVVWANVHASVLVAPVIIAARLAATFVDGGFQAVRASRDLIMLPAVVLATICTPLGLQLPIYAATLATSPIRHFIVEWQPSSLFDGSFSLGALPLAIGILLGGASTLLRRKRELFPAALLFVGTLFASRNVPLFAIAAAPLCATGLSVRFPGLSRVNTRLRELQPLAIAGIAIAVVLAALPAYAQRRAPSSLPVSAITRLGQDGADHRLFCENFTWCSIALAYPHIRVFMDGRCDPYPLPLWQEYVATIRGEDPKLRILRDRGVDTVVTSRGGVLAQRLAVNRGWRVASLDGSYAVFRRE
jgi:hypothetical protein